MDLREYIFRNRLTITAMAQQLMVNRNYLARIVNGHLIPSKRLAKDIERCTNQDVKAEEFVKMK